MTGWHRPDVVKSSLDHLAQVVGATSAQQMVDGLLAKGRAQRDDEVRKLRDRVADLEAALKAITEETEPQPEPEPEAESDSPAARAAREIQELHDPAICGYVSVPGALRIILRPAAWQDWEDWQKRLNCPAGLTTYRGGSATAHGTWGEVPVVAVCYLDRITDAPKAGDR